MSQDLVLTNMRKQLDINIYCTKATLEPRNLKHSWEYVGCPREMYVEHKDSCFDVLLSDYLEVSEK